MSSCPPFGVCAEANDCWDESKTTASCWNIVWIQIAVGCVCIAYGEVCLSRQGPVEMLWNWCFQRRGNYAAELEAIETKKTAFVAAVREEDSFIQIDTADFFCKSGESFYSPAEYSMHTYAFTSVGILKNLYYLFVSVYIHAILIGSIGWGLLSGSLGTVLWLITSYDGFCFDQGYIADQPNAMHIQGLAEKFRVLYSQFSFLPVFLLVSYLGFVASRWRDFVLNCHALQDAAADIALLCGGELPTPVSTKDRKTLYKIYRYLNCLHAMTYKSVSPTLQKCGYCKDFVNMGLLTDEEAKSLLPTQERNCVLALLVQTIRDLPIRDYPPIFNSTMSGIQKLRATCDGHLARMTRDQPNKFLDLMVVICTLWMILIVVGDSFTLMVYAGDSLLLSNQPCFQPLVVFGVFLLTGIVRIAFVLIYVLRYPFKFEDELIKVDGLLSSTDRTTFTFLRAAFGKKQAESLSDEKFIDEM